LLGLSAANLAAALGQGYPVAGGLSQSSVNDKARAKTLLALVFAQGTDQRALGRAARPHVAFLGRNLLARRTVRRVPIIIALEG
jgi:hypothetical protein